MTLYTKLIKLFWLLATKRNVVYSLRIIRSIHIRKIYKKSKLIKDTFRNNISQLVRHSDIQFEVFEDIIKYVEHDQYIIFGFPSKGCIDCDVDLKTNFRWESGKFYFKYKIGDLSNNSDIKFPWEVSRCHHLLYLGESYLATNNQSYASKIADEIKLFIEKNPYLYSVNWTCAMEVSIRACNWIYAVSMISNSEVLNEQFLQLITTSLFQHKVFIEHNLEKGYPYSANHYFADLVGLIHLNFVLGINDKMSEWIRFEFFNEIRSQVLPSGFHFEKSTSYHRLVLEMALYTIILLHKADCYVPEDVKYRIKMMAHCLDEMTLEDGSIPLIGDCDSGKFLPFTPNANNNNRILLTIASTFLNDKSIINTIQESFVDYDILLSEKSNSNNIQHSPRESILYEDANFCIMRSKLVSLYIHNNPCSRYTSREIGARLQTHSHFDMLSFSCVYNNNWVFVDPGTACYTSSSIIRNKYRSTLMHNTICVEGIDQQEVNDANLFLISQYSFPTITELRSDNSFIGEYKCLMKGHEYIHHRELRLIRNTIILNDTVDLEHPQTIKLSFHLAPNYYIEKEYENGNVIISNNIFTCNMHFDFYDELRISIVDDEISPSYGITQPTKTVVLESLNTCSKYDIVTTISFETKK